MKIKKMAKFRPVALAALGVFLGRGAQADTILDFDIIPVDQQNNSPVNQTFGDNATNSSDGITVSGFGTPNIGLTWGGAAQPRARDGTITTTEESSGPQPNSPVLT